jgi:cell division protein FtsI/penicillin-binding protein 2
MTEGRVRSRALTVLLLAFWAGLLVVLGYVQLGRWRSYEAEARRQHWNRLDLPASRGRVFDRLGRALVLNRSCASIRILPQYIGFDGGTRPVQNREKTVELAQTLAEFGLGTREAILAELRSRDRLFRFRRCVAYATAESLRRELVERQFGNCTYVDDDAERVYPYGGVCASVLGFTGEDFGLAGIEVEYDSVLRGRPGWTLLQRDAVGRARPYPSYPVERAVPGADIELTLDVDVQRICYEALAEQVQATGAVKGSAVVLDSRTGAILGLCDFPAYDPERPDPSLADRYKCTALSDQFEPGSSFKLVTCATALESPTVDRLTRQRYDVSAGFIQIGSRRIHDVHRQGVLDFDSLFIVSSNPGCALLSMQLEPARFYEIARGLGFASAVGCGLPNEGAGFLDRPDKLTPLRFANVAFGQGVTVTLVQLAAAYLCVARDGDYLRPYLVESVRQNGRVLRRFRPTVVRRVLRPETAQRIKDILERVVTEGTGVLAQIDGIPTCGKTGTAQKTEPGGGYSRTRSRMTFVGFFPKVEPRYAIAVLVDEPRSVRFAGSTACPAFRAIGQDLLLLERMRRRVSDEERQDSQADRGRALNAECRVQSASGRQAEGGPAKTDYVVRVAEGG